MPSIKLSSKQSQFVNRRAQELLEDQLRSLSANTDRLFSYLLIGEWLAGIVLSLWISPLTWAGRCSDIHIHVWVAVILGSMICLPPVAVAHYCAGQAVSRYFIAIGQMLYSAMLIHLTGGRIESHFHIFGSLAFLSFYRDWRVLVPATLVVIADHILRGLYFPESVFGVYAVQPWRWLEHTWWVLFEDAFLVQKCRNSVRDMLIITTRQAEIEEVNSNIEEIVKSRTEQLNNMAKIVEQSSDGILTCTADGTIDSWNNGAQGVFGYKDYEIIGKSLSTLIPPEKASLFQNELQEKLQQGKRIDAMETRLLHKQGVEIDVLLFAVPWFTESGAYRGCSLTLHNIAARKAAERRVSEFYSIVSHELRTPLTSIRGVLGLLESRTVEAETAEGMELLEVARTSSDRLIRLINDMLDLKKIESGKLELRKTKIDVKQLIANGLAALSGVAEEYKINLVTECSEQLHVEADWDKATQILTNLVSNAIKFSPCGETVKVVAERRDSVVRISVCDNGPGIAAKDINRLFDKFQQLDSSDSRNFEGTGLGLAISKALAEEHGGNIGVSSELKKGSTFWFELNLLPEKLSSSGGHSKNARKALIVESNATLTQAISKHLQKYNFSFVVTDTVAAAKEQIDAGLVPDLVLLDLQMPDESGLLLLEYMKTKEQFRDVPVIAVSHNNKEEEPHLEGTAFFMDWIFDPQDEASKTESMHFLERMLKFTPKCKVLIVDDDSELRKVIAAQLTSRGLDCIEATDGKEGLQLIESEAPDLVLLDIIMPELDGFAVVNELRQSKQSSQIPLIIYSCKDLDPTEKDALRLGLTRYLVKGEASYKDLVATVEELISHTSSRIKAEAEANKANVANVDRNSSLMHNPN